MATETYIAVTGGWQSLLTGAFVAAAPAGLAPATTLAPSALLVPAGA